MPEPPRDSENTSRKDSRALRPALHRGWRRRCPNCGAGPMFKTYLNVRDTCPVCGEALHHHRVSEASACMTLGIMVALAAPITLGVILVFHPDPAILLAGLGVGCTAVVLYLLPRLKGAAVAFQWARRMHGFATL